LRLLRNSGRCGTKRTSHPRNRHSDCIIQRELSPIMFTPVHCLSHYHTSQVNRALAPHRTTLASPGASVLHTAARSVSRQIGLAAGARPVIPSARCRKRPPQADTVARAARRADAKPPPHAIASNGTSSVTLMGTHFRPHSAITWAAMVVTCPAIKIRTRSSGWKRPRGGHNDPEEQGHRAARQVRSPRRLTFASESGGT
jgi:hypothetical protein